MGIFNRKTSGNSLKNKIESIVKEINEDVKKYSNEKFWIERYGEFEINPKYLAIWVCVNSDAEKTRLAENDQLRNEIKNIFRKFDYPEEAINEVFIGVESEETVQRESSGDWYLHFK